jgi:hypothetical protein
MRILATSDYEYSGDKLDVGHYYHVEEDDAGSLSQNSLFHALVDLYFVSGLYSYPAKTKEDLKIEIKKHLGAGYEFYIYVEQTWKGLRNGQVKRREDVPKNLAIDVNGEEIVLGVLKSWSDYSRKERTNCIDLLIAEMKTAGVSSKKFFQLLDTLEKNSMNRMAG